MLAKRTGPVCFLALMFASFQFSISARANRGITHLEKHPDNQNGKLVEPEINWSLFKTRTIIQNLMKQTALQGSSFENNELNGFDFEEKRQLLHPNQLKKLIKKKKNKEPLRRIGHRKYLIQG